MNAKAKDEDGTSDYVRSAKYRKKGEHPIAKPNVSSGDPTDGRKAYHWTSGYPPEARKEIFLEAWYLFIVLFISLFLIFAIWKGWMSSFLSLLPGKAPTLTKYAYYASSGMLGGIIFGMKHFYRMVARGYWHQDRRSWRIMSPFIAMTISFIVGVMIDASVMAAQIPITAPAIVSIGFLAGYFADEAVGKMYEIASVIFGRSAMTKAGNDNDKEAG